MPTTANESTQLFDFIIEALKIIAGVAAAYFAYRASTDSRAAATDSKAAATDARVAADVTVAAAGDIKEIHVSTNSMKTELVTKTAMAALLQGNKEGQAEAKAERAMAGGPVAISDAVTAALALQASETRMATLETMMREVLASTKGIARPTGGDEPVPVETRTEAKGNP